VDETWRAAQRMFRMRHVVLATRGTVAIMPRQRPLLEYYANSIGHLLPEPVARIHRMTPADDRDDTLHRLREPKRRT
jgi:hypothetical protein